MYKAAYDKSVIFISHRLSTTRRTDRIYMMENGVIIEEGTHEDLLKLKGKYYEMWDIQAGRYMHYSS
jgi:ATP-binding cassette subfamily B protein